MSIKAQDILNSQTNTGEPIKEDSLNKTIERIPIEGTPFWAIGTEVDGYHIGIGKNRITQEPIPKNDITEYINYNTWNIIVQLVTIVVQYLNDEVEKDIEKIDEEETKN